MAEAEPQTELESGGETGRYRFLVLTSYLIYAVGPLVGNGVLTLLGPISADFVTNPTAVLAAIPAFMFPFAFIQLFSGAISDVYGRVPVMVSGLIAFTVGLTVTAYSTSLGILVVGNVVCGIGFGFVNPVLLALLSDVSTPEEIPKRMGIASALASLSAGVGPFIAGQMVVLGWQSYYFLFLSISAFGLVAISIAHRPTKTRYADAGPRMFVRNLGIELRKPVVLLMLGSTFLVALVYLGALVWTSRGLTGVLDENLIGLILLGAGASGATAGSLLGPIARRRGFALPIGLGFLALFGGLITFLLLGDITSADSVPLVGLALAGMGWAGGLLFPMMITYSQIISPTRRGVLAGAVTFSFFFGSALNPTLYAPLFAVGMSAVYAGMLVVSVVLAIFVSVLYRKLKPMYLDIGQKSEQ